MNNTNRIGFEKPNLPELTKHYTVVDMHFHTHYSDGFSAVEEIANRVRELGIGIAITDHNEIGGAVEIHKDTGILSIPGIEITSKEGAHLLIYFYDIESLERFYENEVGPYMGNSVMSSISLKAEEVIERARAFKAIIIFPHPYCAAGNMICIHNVVAVLTTVGLLGQEGTAIRKNLPIVLLYALLSGALAWAIAPLVSRILL